MDNSVFLPLLLTMIVTTYLIRAIPFVLFREKIQSPKVKSFFDYIPYSVLSAMTFPSILYATDSIISAAAGFIVALILAYKGKSLLIVAIGTCVAAFLVALVQAFIF
ncbi:MAG: AzlD domain-containing protein [Saccharofermentans sp.]|nr:AzlD domain-containing protein [Saccharofermentans sp.]